MRIALIGPAHPLRGGGISTFNERLAGVLQQQGHEVTIYSFSLQYPSFLFPGKSQFTDEAAPEGLTIKSIINSINPLNWLQSGNTIAKAKPDLVIVRYWLPFMGPALGTILRIIRRNRHSRIICIADNVVPHEKRAGDVAFTKYFIKPVDAFLTMSREVLADLKKFTSKPAVFQPHPVYDNYGDPVTKEDACKKLGIDPRTQYLLFFGFIRKYKGLDILLDAMKQVKEKNNSIKLIVGGEFYDDRSSYDQQIKQHNLENNVLLFTEFIPNDDVKHYFCAADIIVQPYRSATQSGITQIAYHFNKPMIVTNVGGLAEVIPDGKAGYVTEPDASAIADAIIRFFQPNAIPNLEENLREEKRKYSWEVFTKTLLDISGFRSE